MASSEGPKVLRVWRQTDVTLCSADSLGVGGMVTGAGSTRSSRSRKMSHTAVGICKVAQSLVPGKLFMFVPHVFGAFAIESHHLLVDLGIDRSLVAFVVREVFALVLPRREPLVVCRPSLHGVGVVCWPGAAVVCPAGPRLGREGNGTGHPAV